MARGWRTRPIPHNDPALSHCYLVPRALQPKGLSPVLGIVYPETDMQDNDQTSDLDDFEEHKKSQVESYEWRDIDRSRGILTKDDRKYLLGEKDLEGQDEINKRYKIRQRVIQALIDIVVLYIHLDDGDRKQIANDDRVATALTRESAVGLAYDLLYYSDDLGDPVGAFEQMIAGTVAGRAEVTEPLEAFTKPPEEVTSEDILEVRTTADVDIEINHEEYNLIEFMKHQLSMGGKELPEDASPKTVQIKFHEYMEEILSDIDTL